jgi:hypothetical protein
VTVELRARPTVDDAELSALHAAAFRGTPDFLPEHAAFYLDRCGFTRTDAGVLRLAA